MKTLKIEFNTGGAELSLDELVDGTDATIQAALVNMGTIAGSDPTLPDRGTDLLMDAVSGKLINQQAAMHSANFAAIDTLFFIRANEPVESGDKIREIITEPLFRDIQRLEVNLQFIFESGLTVGVLETLFVNE